MKHPLRLVLFTHPHCSLCVPVKNMVTELKVCPILAPQLIYQNSPQFRENPFLYHEVNILAPENTFWNTIYGLKIPVLNLYRRREFGRLPRAREKFFEPEKAFWDDELWNGASPSASWTKDVKQCVNFKTKEMEFRNTGDLAKWIWGQ
jgi:Glutaredoxin-like domain (DUF836)